MIYQGWKVMVYCSEFGCKTPVASYGNVCGTHASIRLAREQDLVINARPIVFLVMWAGIITAVILAFVFAGDLARWLRKF